ncbi:MAG: uroporphyrinogen decarboxylase family protein [Oscillospiraceae bacterium]|nr:uroporphyrinogen decarboxylase family protein [Oscillospiraceae bacterium]
MTSRERVINAFNYKKVDRPAVQYLYYGPGYYEHGEKLNDLYEKYPGDFGGFARQPIPVLPPENFDPDGRYHVFQKDDWGTTWEYRVYGMMGHAVDFPVKSLEDMAKYKFPDLPDYTRDSQAFEGLKNHFANFRKDYFALSGGGGAYMERISGIRGFDNFLMDLYDDSPEINNFLDRITDYYLENILAIIKAGAEGISFGDDYGTQNGLILSKDLFRHAIKPRLQKLTEPIKKAGLHIHFHSCGRVLELFDDFKDIGVNSVWLQMPVYDMTELRDACREYNFSAALHPDRAVIMTLGTPEDVRELVLEINEIFKPKDGGSWFYIEADTGFPFENIKSLVETVYSI